MITIDTPAGPFTMIGDGEYVTRAWFGPPVEQTGGGVPAVARTAVERFLAGEVDALGAVPVHQPGTEFHRRCWKILRDLRRPVSYTMLADLAGRPTAVRAAAQACARNEIALITPCHRVLRADGSLGGYRWGIDVKRWLLDHEERHRAHLA